MKMMILLGLFLLWVPFLQAEKVHLHLSKEVRIVGYNGPADKEVFGLFRNAEILEIIDSDMPRVTENLYSDHLNLKVLYLENDTFDYIDHERVLNGAKVLEEQYFINCSWKHPHIEVWRGVPKLKKLVIKNSKYPFIVIPDDALKGTPLEYLEVSNSGVESIEDLAFNNLDKLEILNLRDNKLNEISREALKPLKNLRVLDLGGNKLKSFGVENLPELPNLEEISVGLKSLEKLNLAGIRKVAPKLKSFSANGKQFSETELNAA